MDVLSYSDTRANLKEVMDRVVEDRAPVVITRQKAESLVIVSLSDWHAMEETIHLLSSPPMPSVCANRSRNWTGPRRRAHADRAVKLVFSEQAWEDYLHWQAPIRPRWIGSTP
jgi:prevent-host-death family protein